MSRPMTLALALGLWPAALRIGLAVLTLVLAALFGLGLRRRNGRPGGLARPRSGEGRRRQSAVLRLLKEDPGNLEEALCRLTETSSATLGVERVSVWIYEGAPDRIVCLDLFTRATGRHESGTVLAAVDFPGYFNALRDSRVLSADDAHADPRTREFSKTYLTPLGITSMMDVPVWLGGNVVGIVCHEHVGPVRSWKPEEEEFASSIADVVAVGLASRDRRRAEEALRDSERRFRVLAETVPEIVFSARPDGVFDYVNPRWREYAGDVAPDSGWLSTAHPADRTSCESRWKASLSGGGDFDVQCRLRRACDGAYRWHLLRAIPVHDAQGRVDRWFGTATDIEDQKRTEAELQELRGTLERRVADRTTRLETALLDLDSFAYTVAHDLRAPLRSMVGYCQILLEDEAGRLSPDSQSHLGRISAAAGRMDQLIRDLLNYSRLSRADVRLEKVDVQSVVDEIIERMTSELRERGAEVAVEGPLMPVWGHRLTLELALTNLLSNAVKFVAPGVAPRIRIRTERRDEWIRLDVEDNGLGVPAEYRERIFGVFERLQRDEKYPGTGIGLAIARKSVERMGGRTGVDPAPGGGSRFWIEMRPLPPA
jgi:PAS domain S-box-containing protein